MSDGVTHINIFSKGSTWLGRKLSHFAHTPFTHKYLGHFECVEGLWYWLYNKDDHLRILVGYMAKQYGRSIKGTSPSPEVFKKAICQGNWDKLNQHPDIYEALKRSTLPFRHYYMYNDKVVPAGQDWLVNMWESFRKAVKPLRIRTAQMAIAKRQPDFLDITVKSAEGVGKRVAPTWDMVMGHKSGKYSDEDYIRRYIPILNKADLKPILWKESITLGCYCRPGNFCHRHVLTNYLVENYGAIYEGEIYD